MAPGMYRDYIAPGVWESVLGGYMGIVLKNVLHRGMRGLNRSGFYEENKRYWFRIQGSGFKVLGFRFLGLGFKV